MTEPRTVVVENTATGFSKEVVARDAGDLGTLVAAKVNYDLGRSRREAFRLGAAAERAWGAGFYQIPGSTWVYTIR